MRTILIICAVIITPAHVFAHQPLTAQNSASQAIVYLASGDLMSAGKLLVDVFNSPKSSIKQKFNAALLLAGFPPGSELYAERATYAKFVLSHPLASSRFNSEDKRRLLRIEGLGWYQQEKWENAYRAYEKLIGLGSASDREFGQLQLGWIEVNRGRSVFALKRWLNWLSAKESETMSEANPSVAKMDSTWGNAILRDLGQILIESKGGNNSIVSSLNSLKLANEQLAHLQEGMTTGFSTAKISTSLLSELNRRFAKSPLKWAVIRSFFSNDDVVQAYPCEMLKWIEVDEVEQLRNIAQADTLLKSCLLEWNTLGCDQASVLFKYFYNSLSDFSSANFSSNQLISLSEMYLSKVTDDKERRRYLERMFSDPIEALVLKQPMPLLWWIKSLQSDLSLEQLSEVSNVWLNSILTNEKIIEASNLKKTDYLVILLNLSLRSKRLESSFHLILDIENEILKSRELLDAYIGWLSEMMKFCSCELKFCQNKIDQNSIAYRYLELGEIFKNLRLIIESKPNLDATLDVKLERFLSLCSSESHLNVLTKLPLWKAGTCLVNARKYLHKSEAVVLNLDSPSFGKNINIKIKSFINGIDYLFQASATVFELKDTLSKIIKIKAEQIEDELNQLKVPADWTVIEESHWKIEKRKLLDRLQKWIYV